MKLVNEIQDTALIFEGGGMRASYTAGILNNLLENKIYFNYVAGISAGASHSVNYLSRDIIRAKRSFVDFVLDPNFGGWKSFLKGNGYFNAYYIYEQTPHENACLPFDFKTFIDNPAKLRIGTFDMSHGKMKYFSKNDMHNIQNLMKIVRSSSSMPIFMPPTQIGENVYVDGGLGGGIALDIAQKDGMNKYFVVLSREKGYRKSPIKFKKTIYTYYKKYPLVADAMINRHIIYNETLDKLYELEKEGRAFLVFPDTMPVTSRETNFHKLTKSYQAGYAQGKRDLPRWKEFLHMK
jgi:predicted patatin/cPLA2 family phospholipase